MNGGSSSKQSAADSLSAAVSGLSQGISSLVRGHLALARVEMGRDLKALAHDLVMEMGGAPILLVGYLLLWMGIGFLLGLIMPAWIAFLICAVINFALGFGLISLGHAHIKKQKNLRLIASVREINRDKDWIASLRRLTEAPAH